ncbi:acetylserotonin O-methyltransferase [Streptomyces sp. NBC_00481]|uniref:methyltransferase n=1 Tax=unclassified Streptomyces TaxID=2593676 RepID=UPI002DD7EEC5|nr:MULTISPECIES: methyltransferase [unclassified Streptomyces]WRZ01116.1 acetylserotonin O-methyltransferase [Streptomyces sp. NBC_00481]
MRQLNGEQREAAVASRRMLYDQLPSRALVVVVQIGVPDLLAEGPLAVDVIAERTGTDAAALNRLLRALAVLGAFEEVAERVYGLTALGRALTLDHPASVQPSAKLVAGVFGSAWDDLLQTVRTGTSPLERARGASLFTLMERDDELRRVFDDSQGRGLVLELDELLRYVDFSGYGTVVDVGGSDGTFLRRILEKHPQTRGICFDLPGSVSLQAQRAEPDPLADRYRVVGGSFFDSVPGGGDLYLLSHILHDWDDDKAVQILRTVRAAMTDSSTVMIVDLIGAGLGQRDEWLRTAAVMDLYMLSLFGGTGGQERTTAQVESLLSKAGFRVSRVDALPSGMNVIRAVPAEATGV